MKKLQGGRDVSPRASDFTMRGRGVIARFGRVSGNRRLRMLRRNVRHQRHLQLRSICERYFRGIVRCDGRRALRPPAEADGRDYQRAPRSGTLTPLSAILLSA